MLKRLFDWIKNHGTFFAIGSLAITIAAYFYFVFTYSVNVP